MTRLLHDLIFKSATTSPESIAITHKKSVFSYSELANEVNRAAYGLRALNIQRFDRVAIYLPKQPETVFSFFGASKAGAVFVPVNPLLKPNQVKYILDDCNLRILITSKQRLSQLKDQITTCEDLRAIVCIDDPGIQHIGSVQVFSWQQFIDTPSPDANSNNINSPLTDNDMAAILYTSGSTGNPKGVVLSHRNMVVGAESVSEYLQNSSQDKILAVLPFSFDYGLSQLTTCFNVGAHCYLMDYLLPNDVIKAIKKHQITGFAAVPPLWSQLVKLDWPEGAGDSLRYFTNTGGAMPEATLNILQQVFPNASPYLMYGLTEAFRSTYLPPEEVATRPTSMGKAIPNAEILVVREDGSECAPHEPGELVHRGPLVSQGYWNAPEKTKQLFKPSPNTPSGITTPQLAVWSGDTVKKDEEGFLYFIGRKDDMIKSSGYRISPTEVEEAVYQSNRVTEVAALGIPHPSLGQAVTLVATRKQSNSEDEAIILKKCRAELPNFMIPQKIIFLDSVPHNPNGKIDRKALTEQFKDLYNES